ncbi:hypothetical protein L195_g004112 [Trifolium pratense]|uniref:Uncharacterized protein n=1 Tax=Trifolium pratense TaxID=57577 RepID=A0A2K3NX36_TRIPR|nr:hypothetical protein L195_g004112 [Trifolium pratense]
MSRLLTQKTTQVPTAPWKTGGETCPPSPLTEHKTLVTIEPDDVDAKPTSLLKNTLDEFREPKSERVKQIRQDDDKAPSAYSTLPSGPEKLLSNGTSEKRNNSGAENALITPLLCVATSR